MDIREALPEHPECKEDHKHFVPKSWTRLPACPVCLYKDSLNERCPTIEWARPQLRLIQGGKK